VSSILVLPWPADLTTDDCSDVAHYNKNPEEEKNTGHGCAGVKNSVAAKTLTDLDGGNCKSYIGENTSVPIEVKVVATNCLCDSDKGD